MMCQYLRQMGQQSQLRVAALIAKLEVTPLYAKCGFLLVGKSAVVHGKGVCSVWQRGAWCAPPPPSPTDTARADPWFEMRYQFSSTPQVCLLKCPHSTTLFMAACRVDGSHWLCGTPNAQYPVFQADAFTDKPFAGNPAGLVVLSPRFVAEDDVSGLPPDEWMQVSARSCTDAPAHQSLSSTPPAERGHGNVAGGNGVCEATF